MDAPLLVLGNVPTLLPLVMRVEKAQSLSRIFGGAVGTGSQDTGPLETVDEESTFVPWETKGLVVWFCSPNAFLQP